MPNVHKTSSDNHLVDCGVVSVQRNFDKSRQLDWPTSRETGWTRVRRLSIGMQIHERVGYHRRVRKLSRNWGSRKTERAHSGWRHLIVHQPRRRWRRCPGIQWIRRNWRSCLWNINVCGWRNHRTTIQEPVALRRQPRMKGCHDVQGCTILAHGLANDHHLPNSTAMLAQHHIAETEMTNVHCRIG